jgi:hypothetical protein
LILAVFLKQFKPELKESNISLNQRIMQEAINQEIFNVFFYCVQNIVLGAAGVM